ncbi:Phosphatidate cytidylyltransferase 2 [Choanephora cucurbitarum]|uniref:phosphatidate cytidylyltransferase n=1 Tax=Choanephora cucurbitarum TaxID=101091 RepID=A0A1C7NJT7_9FUNG|nr:Phosphatidate cytidylyltransferase 2 [Choanephora cucurbitarum]
MIGMSREEPLEQTYECSFVSRTYRALFATCALRFCNWVLSVLNQCPPDSLGSHVLHVSWVHLCVLYTVPQPILIYHNIDQGGIFWFLFPSMLVVCNDIAAYVCGRRFGKTKLVSLSPNKTLEGFIGALVVTVLWAFIAELDVCIRFHAVMMALFASLISPFGGFFASAVKRASGLKDFDEFIPGHGGLSDRVDCQLFMAMFTFAYYHSFIAS